MKRTTYILIGMLVSGLLILIVSIYYVSVKSARNLELSKAFWSDSLSVDAKGIRAIEFNSIGLSDAPNLGRVSLIPLSKGRDGQFIYSKKMAHYFDIKRISDTLVVSIRVTDELIKKVTRKGIPMGALDFVLEVDSAFSAITSKDMVMNVALSDLKLDTLGINVKSYQIRIDSCRIGSLDATLSSGYFDVTQSVIQNLYLDLDGLYSLSIMESKIGTEHLMCGERTRIYNNDDYDKLIWIPKNDEAEMNINLKGKPCVIIRE